MTRDKQLDGRATWQACTALGMFIAAAVFSSAAVAGEAAAEEAAAAEAAAVEGAAAEEAAAAEAAPSAEASQDLPDTGADAGVGSGWDLTVFYENDTHHRMDDATDEMVGLSKFRNTLQAEYYRGFAGGWSLGGILRGTFDGVYRANEDEFGNDAGGPIQLENSANFPVASVPHGGGIVNNASVAAIFGLTNNAFGFDITRNPNEGLHVLGQRWHDTEGGAAFGVPVRPCDKDSRGCEDFGGYGDQDLHELEFPEFNERLDFIRELYVENSFQVGGKELYLKVGRQQVVWGRTDLFRVLDVINPVDFSRNNIYDELEDIRIPMGILNAEYRMGASESLQDRNLQLVWIFEPWRANNLGQCGQPNVILDAGCFFRGMVNLWDNGGTVANFAPLSAVVPGAPGFLATDFGPNQIGLRNVDTPDEFELDNQQVGLKFEGVTGGGLAFSLNAFTFRSQLPSLHAFNTGPINPFIGVPGNIAIPGLIPVAPPVTHLIAFDMEYPRIYLFGGSMDFAFEDPISTAVRIEMAVTEGEEFPNTTKPELFSENNVFRSVIGLDRPTFIPFLSSKNRTTLISGQVFFQHIFDHDREERPFGEIGIPDFENTVIATLLVKAFYRNDRLSPQIIFAHDFQSETLVAAPAVEWLLTDQIKLTVGANAKWAFDEDDWKFDDCRSCNPYPPFTTAAAAGQPFVPGSFGLGGFEPLGRFRAGPIGAAHQEDELFLTFRYTF